MPAQNHPDSESAVAERDFLVVAVGASAGGLKAIQSFFHGMPVDSGMAFIVIQHLSPHFPSHMVELLSRHTQIPVMQVKAGVELQPDTIYLIPPKKDLVLEGSRLQLAEKNPSEKIHLPIDRFFTSLARERRKRSIGVILSGTGSDGTRGCREIRDAGGLVVTQDEESAEFPGMPLNVQKTGVVDLVLPPESMAPALVRYARGEGAQEPGEPGALRLGDESAENQELLTLLRDSTGIDFSLYKPATIGRRLQRRQELTNCQGPDMYLDLVRESPTEREALGRDLLIGVTEFFRDREAFEFLAKKVLSALVEDASETFRAWICGCANGQEAYTVAILLCEEMRRQKKIFDVKIFATDVHRQSLEQASTGVYSAAAVDAVPLALREHYFKAVPNGLQVIDEVRRMVVFAPHNVLVDAPFTRLDLICCRNLMIYLKAEAQRKVLSLFHFALKRNRYLFLGESESPGPYDADYEVVHERFRVFRKVGEGSLAPVTSALPRPVSPSFQPRPKTPLRENAGNLRIYDQLLAQFMPPGVLIDAEGLILHSFPGAEEFVSFPVGRPSLELSRLVHEGLREALEELIKRVLEGQESAADEPIRLPEYPSGSVRLEVRHISDGSRRPNQMLVLFQRTEFESGKPHEAPADPGRRENLERELRLTRENLRATIEQLETSNEELQATNEELTSANEELQSSNEELHSVNEELHSVNAEYQNKIAELNQMSADMESLLVSTEVGMLFLDENLRIRRFTPRVVDLFPLQRQDIGREIGSFSHRFDDPNLERELRKVLANRNQFEREVVSSNQETFLMRILPYQNEGRLAGVVMTFINIQSLKDVEAQNQRLLTSAAEAIVGVSPDGRITFSNPSAKRMLGFGGDRELRHDRFLELLCPDPQPSHQKAKFAQLKNAFQCGAPCHFDDLLLRRGDGGIITAEIWAHPVQDRHEQCGGAVVTFLDISDRKAAELALDLKSQDYERTVKVLTGVLNNLPDMTFVLDRGRQVEFASPTAEAFLEHFSSGRKLPMELNFEVQQVLDSGEDFIPVNYAGVREMRFGEEIRSFLPRITAMKNSVGEVSGAVVLLQDVTEFRFLDEVKTNLLGTVSHELKTPVTSIRMALWLLLEKQMGELNDAQHEIVETARGETERLLRNLNILLDLTRFEQGHADLSFTTIPPQHLAEEALTEYKASHRCSQPMELRVERGLPNVKVDKDRILHVLRNLISNAVKYSPEGETVELRVEHCDLGVRFSVLDRGPGVPEEFRQRVFDKFFKVPSPEAKSGSGLGLSIVKEFIQAHGGHIGVEPNGHQGSCFYFEIRSNE